MSYTSPLNDTPLSGSISSNATLLRSSLMEDSVNTALFSTLLLATLLLAGILHLYYRHRLDNQANVLVILQSYLVHTVLAANVTNILPLLVCLTTGKPWSYLPSELIAMAVNVLICLLILLTVGSSIIKLFLVTHFSWWFTLDPHQLARHVLGAAVSLALFPNLAFILWIIFVHNGCSNAIVCYLVGSREEQFEINFGRIYFLVWLLISLLLAALVVFGIPIYLKRAHTTAAVRNGNCTTRCIVCSSLKQCFANNFRI